MLVLEGFHHLAGTAAVLQQKYLIGGRTRAECGLVPTLIKLLERNRLVLLDDVAQLVFLAFVSLVLPAAGVGAGALIGVALVDVAREQTAS